MKLNQHLKRYGKKMVVDTTASHMMAEPDLV